MEKSISQNTKKESKNFKIDENFLKYIEEHSYT
jgi:hypothetical protein